MPQDAPEHPFTFSGTIAVSDSEATQNQTRSLTGETIDPHRLGAETARHRFRLSENLEDLARPGRHHVVGYIQTPSLPVALDELHTLTPTITAASPAAPHTPLTMDVTLKARVTGTSFQGYAHPDVTTFFLQIGRPPAPTVEVGMWGRTRIERILDAGAGARIALLGAGLSGARHGEVAVLEHGSGPFETDQRFTHHLARAG